MIVAVVTCVPVDPNEIEVLRYENDNIGVDGYKFAWVDKFETMISHNDSNLLNIWNRYEQSDGVSRSEEAVLKNAGTEQEALEVRGVISWTAPDGEVYTLNFVADENGYHPEGAHLPHL